MAVVTGAAVSEVSVVSAAKSASRTARAGTKTTARWLGSLNVNNEAAVNAAYWSLYATKQSSLIQWLGGSLALCLPGLTSLFSNDQTLTSLNFVRSLAGLAPVAFSGSMNASAQRAALIMAANNGLDHHPTSAWRCWTPSGASAASKSNLALAWPSLSAGQIIDLYMDDTGSTNTAVGHRRWLLNPFSTVMGSGSTRTANALTVIGPTSAARPNPAWVGWPTAGYFPNRMEPGGRWSLSSGLRSVSFARASVAVFLGTHKLRVRKFAVEGGYAQPTIVWQMPSAFPKTSAYRVVVSGIHRAGMRKALKVAYTVRLFTPSQ
jgi:hypothetical protein